MSITPCRPKRQAAMMDRKPVPKRGLIAILLMFPLLVCYSPASSKEAKPAQPEPFLSNVRGWWVLDNGKILIVHKNNRLATCDINSGATKSIGKEPGSIRQLYRISKNTLGYEVHGENFSIMDTQTGKVNVCVAGKGNYEPFGIKPNRGWFVVMAIRMSQGSNFEFHQVDLRTRKTRRLYDTNDQYGVENFKITDDGKYLVVWTESDDVKTIIRRTVDLKTLKVKVSQTPRWRKVYPLVGGGRIVKQDHKLVLERKEKLKDIFPQRGRVGAIPNCKKAPRWLAVQRLTDTNNDGRISRNDGDFIELWLLDLASLKKTQLADSICENIVRGWSKDGKYFAFSRWDRPDNLKGNEIGNLVIYEPATKQRRILRPPAGKNYVSFKDFHNESWLLVRYELTSDPTRKSSSFHLLDLKKKETTLVAITGRSDQFKVVRRFLLSSRYNATKRTYNLYRMPLPRRTPCRKITSTTSTSRNSK